MPTKAPEKVKQKRTPNKKGQAAFLAALSIRGTIAGASEDSGVGRTAHYQWMKDPAYAKAFDEAGRIAGELLENEARRRATQGVQRPKFHDGQMIMIPHPGGLLVKAEDGTESPLMIPYTESTYSDTLLIFLLKGAMPEKYRERAEDRVSVTVDLKAYVGFDPECLGTEREAQTLPSGGERSFTMEVGAPDRSGLGTDPDRQDESMA